MAGSAVHAAMVDLTTLLQTALPSALVLDGLPTASYNAAPSIGIYIGVDSLLDMLTTGNPFPVQADGGSTWAGLGASKRTENFNIRCCVFGLAAGVDVPTERAAVFALYAQAEAAIRGSGNLGGAVLFAGASVNQVRGGISDRGTGAEVQFTVICEARI